jgi:hypothetical protein
MTPRADPEQNPTTEPRTADRRKLRSNARRLSVAASRVNPPSLRLAPGPSSRVPGLRLVATSCVPVRVRAACVLVLLTKVENILGRFHPRPEGPGEDGHVVTRRPAGLVGQRTTAATRRTTTKPHDQRPLRAALDAAPRVRPEPLKTSTHHNAGEVFRRACCPTFHFSEVVPGI